MAASYLSLVTTTQKTITMQNRDMNLPASTIEKVQALLARNQKINAVKLVHDTARCSLKEAKDYVDGLEESTRFTAGQEVPNAVKPLAAPSKRTSTPIDQALRQQAGAERSGASPVRIISMVLLLVIVAVLAWFLMRK